MIAVYLSGTLVLCQYPFALAHQGTHTTNVIHAVMYTRQFLRGWYDANSSRPRQQRDRKAKDEARQQYCTKIRERHIWNTNNFI